MLDGQINTDTKLEQLISSYVDARTAWLATAAPDGDLTAGGIQFERLETACLAVLGYSCPSFEAVSRKISLILEDADLYAIVREDEIESEDILRVFLASLIANVPASESPQ